MDGADRGVTEAFARSTSCADETGAGLVTMISSFRVLEVVTCAAVWTDDVREVAFILVSGPSWTDSVALSYYTSTRLIREFGNMNVKS